jgi:hypothetical protein
MSQKIFCVITLYFTALNLFAQTGLYVSGGTNLFISGGTIVSIDSLVLTPSSNFLITGQNTFTRTTSVSHHTANNYVQRVFHLSSTLASFTGTIGIYYRDAELNGITENALTLNIHDGISWKAFTNATRDPTNNLITTSGLSNVSLNELTLASLSSPLPLSFTFFSASCTGSRVLLSWKTAEEVNTKDFDIERSGDGQHWQITGSIAAAGSSTTQKNYTWMDSFPLPNSLYRIVEKDIDGRKNISSVIRSSCSFSESFTVYPNPVHDGATISINLRQPATVTLRLYDTKGSLITQKQTSFLPGTSVIQFDMRFHAVGVYNLTAQWGNEIKTIKIVKE